MKTGPECARIWNELESPMADDAKNCGKKRSSLDCGEDCPFHRIGLPIMPLRYAVLKNDGAFPALDGDLNTPQLAERPLGDSARYGVRLLRPGYLYVYDEARSELKGYYVNENATLYNFDLDKPVQDCDRTFTCTMDHEAKASLLTIPNAKKATFVWLAFSDVQWTKDVCKAHKGKKGADMRERHMFKFDVQAWLSGKKHPQAKSIKTLKDTAADYVVHRKRELDPYGKQQLLGWSTIGYYDVHGWMGGMIEDAAEAFSPGNGLMLALPDSTGIMQDLARLMRMRFDEFVSNKADERPLTISKSIESLREIVMQTAETDFLRKRGNDAVNQSVYGTTSPGMASGPGGSGAAGLAAGTLLADLLIPGHQERRKAEAEELRYPTAQERSQVRHDSWKKYLEKYDENARVEWQNGFDARMAKFDSDTIIPMAQAHVAWMKCEKTISSFECNYDSRNVDSGEVFQTVFSLCIDGTQDKRACFDLYVEWLQGDPVDTKNLLLRAMFHNQDLIAEKVLEAHEAAVDWKAIPWGNLHGAYKTGLSVLSDGRLDKTARLLEQVMGPITRVLKFGVDSGAARKLAMYLGLVSQKSVAIVEVEGGKKAFRAALIRELLRQHGAKVDIRQMERAVADELRRLEVKGEQVEGTERKKWFMLVDNESAASVASDARPADKARGLAQSVMTVEAYEAQEMARWRSVINTDLRVGVVSGIFQAVVVYKLWRDTETAMSHESSDASWKFVVGIAGMGGTLADVVGAALKNRATAGMSLGVGVGFETTGNLLVRWGGRIGVISGIIMAVFDLKSAREQRDIEKNGFMGGLYLASAVVSVVVIAAFFWSLTLVGLIASAILILISILIESYKDNKLQEWLKRCQWGVNHKKEGAEVYHGLPDEVRNLRLAVGGDT